MDWFVCDRDLRHERFKMKWTLFKSQFWNANDYYYVDGFTLRKKCPSSELFWSAFFRIQTEYGEIRSISPYSVRMRENGDQNDSEYGHFSRNVNCEQFFLVKEALLLSYIKLWKR